MKNIGMKSILFFVVIFFTGNPVFGGNIPENNKIWLVQEIHDITILQGESFDVLPQSLLCYVLRDGESNAEWIPVIWELSGVDSNVLGKIMIQGTLIPPQGIGISDELRVVNQKIEVVKSIEIVETYFNHFSAQIFEINEEISGLPETVIGKTSRSALMELPVIWKIQEVPSNILGRYLIEGEIQLGQGYTFASGSNTGKIPVIIYDANEKGTEKIKGIENTFDPVILEYQQPINLSLFSYNEGFVTEAGDRFSYRIKWELETVNTNQLGWREITGQCFFPPGIDIEGYETVKIWVYVMENNRIDISVPKIQNTHLYCGWLMTVTDTENIIIWKSKEEGVWEKTTQDDRVYVSNNALIIDLNGLEVDVLYGFYIEYRGTKTEELMVLVKDGDIKVSFRSGDRDGGDRGEQVLPPTNVKPPIIEEELKEETPIFREGLPENQESMVDISKENSNLKSERRRDTVEIFTEKEMESPKESIQNSLHKNEDKIKESNIEDGYEKKNDNYFWPLALISAMVVLGIGWLFLNKGIQK
ncbi:MAG: hypothetical protein ACRCU3_04460 [Eubacteriaceae bacterium]